MTITTNTSTITINSTLFLQDNLSTVTTMTIVYTDCNGNEVSQIIDTNLVSDSEYELTISEGLYELSIIANNTDGTQSSEKNCIFVEYETDGCKNIAKRIKDYLEECKEIDQDIITNYYLISQASNCGCNCNSSCDLWNSIKNKLDNGCECKQC